MLPGTTEIPAHRAGQEGGKHSAEDNLIAKTKQGHNNYSHLVGKGLFCLIFASAFTVFHEYMKSEILSFWRCAWQRLDSQVPPRTAALTRPYWDVCSQRDSTAAAGRSPFREQLFRF